MPRLPLALSFVAFASLTACTGLREVVPGVYRSPQPGETQLFHRVEDYGLRTIVCLRGHGEQSAIAERVAVGTGIDFVAVPMSATRLPKPATLHALWQVAATAERPLLLHCRAGVDRSGLLSALVVLHDTGDFERARGELSLLLGHTGLLGTAAMDEVLDRYEAYAGRMAFPQWIDEVYAPSLSPRTAPGAAPDERAAPPLP